MIGSGIFLTTGYIAQDLPHPGWILFVWALGSVLILFGGLTFAELGAMYPSAGGQYIYLRNAYGSTAGFMYGWTTFLVTQTGGIAALGVGFAEYLSYFFPRLGLQNILLSAGFLDVSAGQLVAVTVILILTAVNYFGIHSGSMVQNTFTILKILAIAALLVAGLWTIAASGSYTAHTPSRPDSHPQHLIGAIGVALIAVLWTFDGWYAVNSVASEIKKVRRNLPLSLVLGISATGFIYLLVNLFYVLAMPVSELQGVVRVGEVATTTVFGPAAGRAMSGLILVSILGCLSATVIYGPRVFYAMARDGLFFKQFAEVHPRYSSPAKAVLGQGIWSALLCLSGTYEQLFTYVVFVTLSFYVACASAVFWLRRTKPDVERPYRVWGYPLVPLLFGLAILWIMINTLVEKPVEALIGLGLTLTGLPVYFYWSRHGNTTTSG